MYVTGSDFLTLVALCSALLHDKMSSLHYGTATADFTRPMGTKQALNDKERLI